MHAKFFRFNHTLFRYNSTWYSLSIPSKFLLFLPLLLFQLLLLTMGVKKYILFVVLHSTRVDPLSSHEICYVHKLSSSLRDVITMPLSLALILSNKIS